MSLEDRMQRIEAAFGAQSDLVLELRNAVTVTAQLEARQGKALKDHSDWLVFHDREMKEHDERMKMLDQRIANLVSGFGEFMRRQDPAR